MSTPQQPGVVTIFSPSLDGGGAERVTVNLANGLARRHRPTEILLLHHRGKYFEQVDASVPVRSLQAPHRLARILTVNKLRRYLRENNPRALVVSGHSAFAVALLARKAANFRLIVIAHNTLSRERGLSRFVARYFYRRADRLVAVSQGVRQDVIDYASIDPDKVTTIYNPVDTDFVRRRSLAEPDHPWLADPGLDVLVAAGSLTAQKNFAMLIKALSLLHGDLPRLRLLILGEGPLLAQLASLANTLGLQDIVDFPGFAANPFSFMRRSHRFVLCSDYEGFGMVLVEALASGARIISTRCPSGPEEILERGKFGVLTPVGDVDAMADAIRLEDSAFPDEQRMWVRAQDFSISSAVEQFGEILDD